MVITMRRARVYIRPVENSLGIVIPKHFSTQLGLTVGIRARISVKGDALVIRKLPIRRGWAEAAKTIAEVGSDMLVLGEFSNIGDRSLDW